MPIQFCSVLSSDRSDMSFFSSETMHPKWLLVCQTDDKCPAVSFNNARWQTGVKGAGKDITTHFVIMKLIVSHNSGWPDTVMVYLWCPPLLCNIAIKNLWCFSWTNRNNNKSTLSVFFSWMTWKKRKTAEIERDTISGVGFTVLHKM